VGAGRSRPGQEDTRYVDGIRHRRIALRLTVKNQPSTEEQRR